MIGRELKVDVERHRAHETELDAKIAEIAELAGKEDPMSIASLRVYRRFRAQLLQSKADVVTKIGKRNEMNERFRELRKQAAREVSNANQWTDDEWNELFMEKFAELIVRECNRTITNNGIATSEHDQCVRRDCVNEILDNFGINTLL